MLEDYIKKIVKEEIAKDNLNKKYGKNATSVYELYMREQNLNKENEKLKKENEKLEDKLSKISNIVSLYNTNEIPFMSLMSTIDNIRNTLKES